ncbi:MAG: tetratricopeptide repeat protein [Gammaproteobacteria bacterium]
MKIFVSSPGDVYEERTLAQRVLERLKSEYAGRVTLEPVFWEHEPLAATADFQTQIARPSSADIMIAVLWSRLGTRLPAGFTRADGSHFDSGTEYEFEDAVNAFKETGKPHLLVYRKTATPLVNLDNSAELMERIDQKNKLDAFVERWFHNTGDGTLKAAFHPFATPSDFEVVVEHHLHRLIDRLLPGSHAADEMAPAVWKKGSPFRGLQTFNYEHAPIFFGRTRAIGDVLQALRKQDSVGCAFVLILGMSGGGKSSLARAGLLPMLTQPGVIEGVGLWRRAVFRPSDIHGDLFVGLATAMLGEHGLRLPDTSPEELAEVLKSSPASALTLNKTALAQDAASNAENAFDHKAPTARLALLIDQMEEIFTQDWVSGSNRERFVDTLDALARSGRVWIIATLRSDIYPRCASLPKLIAMKEGAGQYDLLAPTATEIGQMVRLPTLAAGLRFEEDYTTNERLDDMLRDAAAASPTLLPLLEFTLEELYQRRTDDGLLTLSAYRKLGGVEGSLARRAEAVFEELPAEVQKALPHVLNHLVHIRQEGHETIGRRRASMNDFETPQANALVEAFIEARLFVTELDQDGNASVMVSHEALLWHWPRLGDWVDQNRDNLRVHGRLNRAAERWVADNRNPDLLLPSGKPLGEALSLRKHGVTLNVYEAAFLDASAARVARLKKLKAGVVALLAVMAVTATGAALVANQQRRVANEERQRAKTEAQTAKRTADFMVDLFQVSDPSAARGESITAREILDAGAQRIESELSDQPDVQATLMDTMGQVYTSLGLYDRATPLLRQALERRKAQSPGANPDVAQTLGNLGRSLGFQAGYEDAAASYREALEIQRELLPPDDPRVADSMSGLAYVLSAQGDFDGASKLLVQALEIRRKSLGNAHPGIARNLEDLGLNQFNRGNYDEAESLLRQSLKMRLELLGDEPHPDIADGLSNLALVVEATGQYDEAERLYRESLKQMHALYGESHPYISVTLNNLAFTVRDQKKYDEAETMYGQVLEMQRELLGERHPDVGMALNNLGIVESYQGQVDASVAHFREALDIYRQAYGEEHPDIATTLNNLGVILDEQGQTEESIETLEQALAMRSRMLEPGHPSTAISQAALAKVLLGRGDYERARELASEARQAFETAVGPDHWRTAAAGGTEGAALAGLERYPEAESRLLASYAVLSENPVVQPSYVKSTLGWLVDLYRAWGRPQDAARYSVVLNKL